MGIKVIFQNETRHRVYQLMGIFLYGSFGNSRNMNVTVMCYGFVTLRNVFNRLPLVIMLLIVTGRTALLPWKELYLSSACLLVDDSYAE